MVNLHKFDCIDGFENVENYNKAKSDNKKWDCHHRLETHKYNKKTSKWEERDIFLSEKDLRSADLYDNVPSWQLIFLPSSEHRSMHKSGKHNPMYGKVTKGSTGLEPPNKGKTLLKCIETDEIKSTYEWKKLGFGHCLDVAKGKRNFSNGKKFIFVGE